MKFSFRKDLLIVIMFICLIGSAIIFSRVFSYNDTVSHSSFTQNVIEIYSKNFEQQLSNEELGWLKWGSIEEDTAPRWTNHFYEPNTDKGLWGFLTSRKWAESPLSQKFFIHGDQTWQKALDAYADGDNKTAFIALGHVLHLLEDASVPAHTRLDSHMAGDSYEKWLEENIQDEINFNVGPIAGESLSDVFYNLAIYSNKYFFSEDTIDVKNINFTRSEIKSSDGKYRRYGIIGDSVGNKFKGFKIEKTGFSEKYSFDDCVHADYFNLLGPKTVAYGAGTIKLFFDEAEKIKREKEEESWWQKMKDWFNSQSANFSGSLLGLFSGSGGEEQNQDNNSQNNSAQNTLNRLIYPQLGQNNDSQNNNNQNNANAGNIVSVQPFFAPQKDNEDAKEPEQEQNQNNNSNQNASGSGSGDSQENSGNITSQFFPPTQQLPNDNQEEQNSNGQDNSQNNNQNSNGGNNQNTGGSRSPEPNQTAPQTNATSTLFSFASQTATTTAIFEFSSTESNSAFECVLDNATSTCSSPVKYENLSETSHEFKVLAINQNNIQDSTPEIIIWTIDLTSPLISNVSASEIIRSSAKINFQNNEATIGKIEYGATIAYGAQTSWETISATSHEISLSGLDFNSTYHFRVYAKDEAGNEAISGDYNFTTSAVADHIVISEFATSGLGGANDEWIELYNPASQAIDLVNYSIQYRGGGSSVFQKKNLNATSTISGQVFFLIANNSYAGVAPTDLNHNSFQMSSTGGTIFLSNTQDLLASATSTSIIDKVAYGAGASLFPETLEFTPAPGATESLERKSGATSTAQTMAQGDDKWQGNGYDTDNNSQDFILQNNPLPQNSQSLIEPRNTLPLLDTSAPWPMFQQNEKHQGKSPATLATPAVSELFSDPAINFTSPPAISQDRIYIGATDGLYAFDMNGSQLWFYPANNGIASVPLISSDGTIYFSAENNGLYAVNSNGILKWHYAVNSDHYASLNIDKNGILYINFNSSKLHAFYPDGSVKWIFDATLPPLNRPLQGGGAGAPAIDNAREKIYINIENYIYAINFDGSFAWDFTPDSFATQSIANPAVGNDGTIYFVAKGSSIPEGGFFALNPNGSVKWSNLMGYEIFPFLAPAIGQDGTVYFSSNKFSFGTQTYLFAFEPLAGVNKWYSSPTGGYSIPSSPLVAGDNIFVGADARVAAYDQLGNAVFGWNEPDNINLNYNFGAADQNGNLYFTAGGKIYKISN